MLYKIVETNIVTISNGEDEVYHIIPSGFDKKYLVVDGGPHFNGDVKYKSVEDLKNEFSLVFT